VAQAAGDNPAHKLTAKQRRFVDAYLGEARFNGTEAARIAGYAKPAIQAHENLRKPYIQQYVATVLQESELTRDVVLALVQEDAMRSDADVLRLASQAPSVPATASAVSAFLAARTTARTNLLKVHRLLTDKIDVKHSGRVDHVHRIPEGLRNLSDDELDALEVIAARAYATGDA
jgi:phage terminase small subunit